MTRNPRIRSGAVTWLLASLALVPGTSQAVDFCVGNSTDLEAALLASAVNGATADTIQVRVGTYLSPANGFGAAAAFGAGDSITIEGGWMSTELIPCATQSTDPSLTIIDGEGVRPAMLLRHQTGGGNMTVRNLTIQNGLRNVGMTGDDRGGGLYAAGFAGYVGDVLVERCIFRGNVATLLGGGLQATSDGGAVTVRNNLFVGNTASQGAAMYVFGNGGISYVNNNTATGNVSTSASNNSVALSADGSNTVLVTNNIFWGNTLPTQSDVLVSELVLLSNDIERPSAAPPAGNFSVDPQFVGASDFRLKPTSPLIDVGIDSPAGGVPALDLAGLPRIQGDAIDLGAYEFDNLFKDSFED